tara:strand:+ start:833 stop:1369 length:537 start_codon:yes stop_codon:yes gene_type:complete
MDLGQNYTQFVDDVEGGEFDNFLSKGKRRKLKAKRDRIKELRKGGMRMKDAIIQASKESMDKRIRDARANDIKGLGNVVSSQPARLKMKRPIKRKFILKGDAMDKIQSRQVADNDVDEEVDVDVDTTPQPIELEDDVLETSVDSTPKEEGFVQKYKTLLMIGGGLAVAFVLFKKFGSK